MNASRWLLGIVLLGICAPGCTCYTPSPRLECWQIGWENRMAGMSDWLMEQNCRYRTRNCQQSAALMAALRNPCVGGMYTDGPMYAAGQACCSGRSRCGGCGGCGGQGMPCGAGCGQGACGFDTGCGQLIGCNNNCGGNSSWSSWLSGWGSSGGCGMGGCGTGGCGMGSGGMTGCGCGGNGWMTGASAGAPMLSQGSILPGPMQNLAQMQSPMPTMAAMPMAAPGQMAQMPAYQQTQAFAPAQPVVAQMQVVPHTPNMPMVQTTFRPIGLQNPLPQMFSQSPQSVPLNSAPMMGAAGGMPMVVTPQAAVPVNTINYGPAMQTAALPVVQAH